MNEYRRRSPDAWNGTKVLDYFRLLARRRMNPANERTLLSAISPPERAHLDGVFGLTFRDENHLIITAGLFASLIMDFYIKTTGKTDFRADLARYIPLLTTRPELQRLIAARVLRLNCLTTEYAALWDRNFSDSFRVDGWTSELVNPGSFDGLTSEWNESRSPIRIDLERRQALLELDVLCCMALGVGLDELQSIYRIQFPVMRQYEKQTCYDQNGRIVFTTNKGLSGVGVERKVWEEIKTLQHGMYERTIEDDTVPGGPLKRTIIYQAPFFSMNRERDYEIASREFSNRLGINHSILLHKDETLSSII